MHCAVSETVLEVGLKLAGHWRRHATMELKPFGPTVLRQHKRQVVHSVAFAEQLVEVRHHARMCQERSKDVRMRRCPLEATTEVQSTGAPIATHGGVFAAVSQTCAPFELLV